MDRLALKRRHLKYLRYIWVSVPFLLAWLLAPGLDSRLGSEHRFLLEWVALGLIFYLAIRTLIARVSGPLLRWDLIFPPFDAMGVAALIWAAGRDPISNLSFLYLLPIVECSESLSAPAIIACSFWIALMEAIATWPHRTPDQFGSIYPFVFIFSWSLICGFLARSVALDREQLAIAQDRNRIASEMHDGVQGHLVSSASQLELISHLIPMDAEKSIDLALSARDSIRLATDELRFVVQRLRSPELDQGFTTSLRQFAYNFTQRRDIDLVTDFNLPQKLPSELEHALFRVAQEALTNAMKHGSPHKISLKISGSDQRVEFSIEDDGRGFCQTAHSGTGITGMQERISKVGGELTIESKQGCGCKVRGWAPIR